jgi:hypothetical protein
LSGTSTSFVKSELLLTLQERLCFRKSSQTPNEHSSNSPTNIKSSLPKEIRSAVAKSSHSSYTE